MSVWWRAGRRSIVVFGAVVVFGAGGLVGCGQVEFGPAESPSGAVPSTTVSVPADPGSATDPAPSAVDQARSALPAVPVRTIPGKDPSYERDAFGASWSDSARGVALAGNGCDTRDDILRRDAQRGTLRIRAGTDGCEVTSGRWVSPYTGATFTSTRRIQIDHIIPLARAWASGAKGWSGARRLAFANDPDNLIAVDGSSNQSKSDKGPGAWRPRQRYQCAYAIRYLRVLVKYQLPMSGADRSALDQMLDTCPD